MIRRIVLLSVVLVVALVVLAAAEEKLGVTVYPGAKFDAATTKAVKEGLQLEVSCYRTNDTVAKVTEFYKKQSGMKLVNVDKESAMFTKGGTNVTVQNPWMDMKTGAMNRDTLVSIGK